MKKLLMLALLPFLVLLGGCASIVSGSNQSLSIDTTPVEQATCTLTNDDGTWYVPSTPGTVTVHRSYADLVVNCHKNNLIGISNVKSTTKGMAFGNILFGGFIGGGVDAATGAAYDYPSLITVPLNQDKK